MKHIITAILVLQVVTSKPLEDKDAKIIRQESIIGNPGNYKFVYGTSNGIEHEQSGKMVTTDQGTPILQVMGAFSFVAPDGKLYKVHYISDEKGYRPQSSVNPEPSISSSELHQNKTTDEIPDFEDRFQGTPINKNVKITLAGSGRK